MKTKIVLGVVGVFVIIIAIVAGMIFIPSLTSSKTSYSESTTLSIISGDVSVREAGGTTWEEAKDGMGLSADDAVRTGANSYALITFFEGTTMQIEPGSEITISEMREVEGTESTIIRLKQTAGETWNRVEKLADFTSRFEIQTSSGVASAKGTTIGLVVGPGGETTMKVYEGRGSLFSQGDVIVGEGMESSAQPGGPASPAGPIPLPDSVLRLSVSATAWMNSVDPLGRSAGMVPPGVVANQIPGAVTSGYGVVPQFVEIPNPENGTYNVVLYGKTSGLVSLTVEGLVRNGNSFSTIFKENRTCETEKDDKWRIDLQARTSNGVLNEIVLPKVIEPLEGDEPGTVVVTQGAFDGRILELADSYDAKYNAFKNKVYAASPGERVVLVFTEDEVAGRLIKWASGDDIPVDFYNMKVELNESGIAEASGKFDYSVFTGEVKVKGKVEIANKKPRVVITNIDMDLGALPIPVNTVKNRINEEAEDATWDLPADLVSVDMGNDQIALTVVKR